LREFVRVYVYMFVLVCVGIPSRSRLQRRRLPHRPILPLSATACAPRSPPRPPLICTRGTRCMHLVTHSAYKTLNDAHATLSTAPASLPTASQRSRGAATAPQQQRSSSAAGKHLPDAAALLRRYCLLRGCAASAAAPLPNCDAIHYSISVCQLSTTEHCIIFRRNVVQCTSLCCCVMHCTAPLCKIPLHCVTMHTGAILRSVMHTIAVQTPRCSAARCTALHSHVPHCIALHCTTLTALQFPSALDCTALQYSAVWHRTAVLSTERTAAVTALHCIT
jgi:hypothetical protein